MNKILVAILLLAALHTTANPRPAAPAQELYSIRIYLLKDAAQEALVDKYLQTALLPALHRQGINEVGVWKPVGNDTAAIRRIYLLIPLKSLDQYVKLPATLAKDAHYLADGKDYIDAPHDNTPYLRMESILLQAFPDMPHHAAPGAVQGALKGHIAERIYELRSYEGPTEKYFENKVQMFNAGGEIPLFDRLGFNAVFYASVLAGSHMPNLMYMTSFENMASHDQHWKDFSADPFWKKLVADPQYQHNVSHVDIVLLHPTSYSDL